MDGIDIAVLDTDGVNAFATPGGYIFITRGMLLQMLFGEGEHRLYCC